MLNNTNKYVAPTTLTEPLPWRNSTLLKGDTANAVARLKQQPGKDLVVLGTGELGRSLMRHNPRRHPGAGSGRRLFPDGGAFAALRLVATKETTTGVLVATYQPVELTAGKS